MKTNGFVMERDLGELDLNNHVIIDRDGEFFRRILLLIEKRQMSGRKCIAVKSRFRPEYQALKKLNAAIEAMVVSAPTKINHLCK